MKRMVLFFLCLTGLGFVHSQVETMKINKETFLKPSLNSLGYLMLNVDTVIWQQTMASIGIPALPANKKVNVMEYKKTADGLSQYVGFDDRFWVLTIIWKDESGNNYITKELKKSLKKNLYNNTGYYKIQYQGYDLIIEIESNKEKAINEMITVEIERK